DPDQEIQEVAVSALCNLKDSRVVRLLAERLKNCCFEQKRRFCSIYGVLKINMTRFQLFTKTRLNQETMACGLICLPF
ncbi:MAG: hypothetical protein ACUVQV_05520, partial [Dissulfurimicrobium sp.]